MTDQERTMLAKTTFNTLCQTLDHLDWGFDKDEDKLTIECKARGNDLPMELIVKVNPETMLISLFSHLPSVVKEDKRLDMAVAISAVNYVLVDGCFDYNVSTGHIFFRMTNSFMESMISEDVFSYMLICSCQTIDEFNDKFMLLSIGAMSLEQFLGTIHGEE